MQDSAASSEDLEGSVDDPSLNDEDMEDINDKEEECYE
jgi:hypothetical protein